MQVNIFIYNLYKKKNKDKNTFESSRAGIKSDISPFY